MSGGGGDTETTQKTEPWEGQQPYLHHIFSEANRLYRRQRPEYFPGSTVAPLSPETTQAQDYLRQYAGPGGPAAQTAQQLTGAQQFALGPVLDVGSNPYVQGAATAAVNPVIDALLERALPAVRQGAIQTGGYGGSRQQLAESNAIRDATRAMVDRTAGLYERAYGQGLDTFGRALALGPQTMQAGAIPAQMLDVVGQQQRDYEQALIDDAIARHNFEQALPAAQLGQYLQFIQGNYGGTTTSTGQAPGGSTASRLLGGAMSGAGLAGMLFPAAGVAAPIGAVAGALLGAFG